MRCVAYLVCAVTVAAAESTPAAARCAGNGDALGTSRVLRIDPVDYARLGSAQYRQTLPLAQREVVLTFDDGPVPSTTGAVLRALAAECVRATFFLVGRQAAAHPEMTRQIHRAGHTIATHSQNHPFTFHRMSTAQVRREVETGIASIGRAIGEPRAVAPFFRIPGLNRGHAVEHYLAARALSVWSADVLADDWHRGISSGEIVRRAMRRLDAKGRGVLLLHDIRPATAHAMPHLLRALKARGYRIVHVVPGHRRAAPDLVATAEPKIQRAARVSASTPPPVEYRRPQPRTPRGWTRYGQRSAWVR